MMEHASNMEAVLFYKAEPVRKAELGKILDLDENAIAQTITNLRETLSNRGVRLIETDDMVELVTAPEAHELIEALRTAELKKDIGKAGAETLAIILYKGPVARSEIDFIRGVNSNFILRNLLIRGLITRIPDPRDQRSYQYKASTECLAYLGIEKKNDLPGYEAVLNELHAYEKQQEEAGAGS